MKKADMKKAIESSFGVKFFGNLIRTKDGILYPLPLVQGNTKLGKKVWHASTLPTCENISATDADGNVLTEKGTCPMTCRGCYGTTNNYKYNSTKYWLIMRTRLLRKYPDLYFGLMEFQLFHEDIEKLRIHATGDFIKGEAKRYARVLKHFPNVKAWTYTKCPIEGDIKALDEMPNCNVVKSIISGCGFNYGHNAYIASVFYRLKRMNKSVYICRCGIDKEQHCSDCNGCSEHEYVLFIEHSTKYNPKKDYGYEKLKWLIEHQDSVKAG